MASERALGSHGASRRGGRRGVGVPREGRVFQAGAEEHDVDLLLEAALERGLGIVLAGEAVLLTDAQLL
jgi:hypothetical protein